MNPPVLLIGFATPLGFMVGLAAVPIVLMFLLKRRCRDQQIGSTLLWARVIQDVLARAPFRRPSEWLSLLLLLLAVAAATMASAGMRWGRGSAAERALVLVIDASASMATREGEDDESRMDLARAKAVEAVGALRDGDLATLIVAAATPRIASHATADTALLRGALDALAVEPVAEDLPAALELAVREATSLQEEAGSVEIVVLSDFAGDPDALTKVETTGLPVVLVACGTPQANAGVIHASVSGELEAPKLLVGLAAAQDAADPVPRAPRTLALYSIGSGEERTLLDAREVTIVPGREAAEVFDLPPPDAGEGQRWVVALEPPDALALDDVAYVGVAENRPPRVLHCGDEDPFLSRLSDVFPGLERVRVAPADLAGVLEVEDPFDLAIVTAPIAPAALGDARLPAARELWIGVVPEDAGFGAQDEAIEPVVVDWTRGHPLLRNVGFENLLFVATRPLVPPDGAQVLLTTSAGAQLAVVEDRERTVVAWAGQLDESNFALIPAFPLFVKNLLGEALGGVLGDVHRASDPLRLTAGLGRLGGTVDLDVTAPSGETQSARSWAREDFFWQGGLETGFYAARAEGSEAAVVRHVGVNLLSRSETSTVPSPPEPDAFESAGVSAVTLGAFTVERPIWRWLIAACALLLTLEMALWARPR